MMPKRSQPSSILLLDTVLVAGFLLQDAGGYQLPGCFFIKEWIIAVFAI
jgi:hypothetical protein